MDHRTVQDQPDNAQEHERLTVNVFEELRAKSPEGVRCLVLKLEDGSYVHSPRSTVSTRSKAGSRSCVLNRPRRAMRPLPAIIRGSRLTQQHENSGSGAQWTADRSEWGDGLRRKPTGCELNYKA
jgi:hypothetical protein